MTKYSLPSIMLRRLNIGIMIKIKICLLIIFASFLFIISSCEKGSLPIAPVDSWIVDTTLITDMVAKVDSVHIRQNMIDLTSYPDRSNYNENIDEVRKWLSNYSITKEIQNYMGYTFEIIFSSPNQGIMYSSFSDMYTQNGGNNWTKFEFADNEYALKDIQFIDYNNGFMTTGINGKIYKTSDGGLTWSIIQNNFGGDAIHFWDSFNGCNLSGQSLYRTSDGGYNWDEYINFGNIFGHDLFVLDSNNAWICSSDIVLKTSNGWKSYDIISVGTNLVYFDNIYFLNDKIGFIRTYDGKYYRSTNAGLQWNACAFLNQNYIQNICFYPPKYVWASTEKSEILFSSNAGETFSQKSNLDIWPGGLFFIDSLMGWISTADGIYKTIDGGSTWIDKIDNIPQNITWENIIFTIPGKKYPSEQILLIAHYDDVGSQGADDNATGTCALLELMNILSNYNFAYTIKIIFFSGEEEGLLGSRYYVKKAKTQGDQIIAVLNFDLLGYWRDGLKRDLNIIHNADSDILADNCLYAIEHYSHTVVSKGLSFGPQSDHESFWSQGFPSIWFCEAGSREEVSPYINSAEDKMESINFNFLNENIKASLAAAAYIAQPVIEK